MQWTNIRGCIEISGEWKKFEHSVQTLFFLFYSYFCTPLAHFIFCLRPVLNERLLTMTKDFNMKEKARHIFSLQDHTPLFLILSFVFTIFSFSFFYFLSSLFIQRLFPRRGLLFMTGAVCLKKINSSKSKLFETFLYEWNWTVLKSWLWCSLHQIFSLHNT